MRFTIFTLLIAACGGNDPSPRVIAGGGIGDGAIDDVANVYVIDNVSYQPIAGATVEIAGKDLTTDATGLAVFHGLTGAQTVVVQAAGYRGEVWQDANGANITVPVTQLGSLTPQQATLTGTIAGYDAISVAAGHIKAAALSYSQNDSLDDSENNIQTPNNGNVCVTQAACNWTLASRTGSVTITATIIDRDAAGSNTAIIGYATAPSVQVDPSVDQSGITLTLVEAGDMQDVTMAMGTPPAALPTVEGIVGIELGGNEVVQLPTLLNTDPTSVLVPMTSVYAPSSTYRLTVYAETSSADAGAVSATIQRGQTTTALASATWLEPPTGVTATRTSAAMDPVMGANIHSVQWSDDTGVVLDITMFDATNTTATVPALVALPSSTLTTKAQGIGAAVDLGNFSLATDIEKIWGESSEPITLD